MKVLQLVVLFGMIWLPARLSGAAQASMGTGEAGNCGHRYVVSPIGREYPGSLNEEGPSDKEVFAGNSKLARVGNPEAAFQLGLAYMQGVGTSQNLALAEHSFEVGAVKPEDKSMVGSFYGSGYCFARDVSKAARWLEAAGRPGDLFQLAEIYRDSMPSQVHEAAALYVRLLTMTGAPEVRRAQMELGNLVIDGKYSAGEEAAGHARNLEWARVITQELLGQEEYKIAVDYSVGRPGLPKDDAMWLAFCRRAARYNIDLAQENYARAISNKEIEGASPFEGYAWMRLASDKHSADKATVRQLEQHMSPQQLETANSIFEGLVLTRQQSGAYYPANDPLNRPSATQLAAMPQNDPDVQLRRAFTLESSNSGSGYEEAMLLYKTVRDRRKMDVRVRLGIEYLNGSDGMARDAAIARFWFEIAAREGSKEASVLLSEMGVPVPAPYAAQTTLGITGGSAGQERPIHIGGLVHPPTVIYQATPKLTGAARRMAHQATCSSISWWTEWDRLNTSGS